MAARSPYEGNIIANWEVMEGILDYLWLKMGMAQDGRVDHPIVMTEPVCNPHHARNQMSEMLFELYGAPSVTYGIDALYSFYANRDVGGSDSGLVMSSGHLSTHVIPVYRAQGMLAQTKRLMWGGWNHTDYLLRLLQLKYPGFPVKVTHMQASAMSHEHCYVSQDYLRELADYLSPSSLQEKDRIIQFPYVEAVAAPVKSEEELRAQTEKRREAGRKLQAKQAEVRAERMQQRQADVQRYRELLANKDAMGQAAFEAAVAEEGFVDEADLEETLKRLVKMMKASRRGMEDESVEETNAFPLVDVPDAELNVDQIKQKRQQKLLKASQEARQKIREEKAREQARLEAERQEDERMRVEEREKWLAIRHEERSKLYTQLKEQQRAKLEIGDRKSMASQQRMKSIASLAANEQGAGAGAGRSKRRRGEEDTFGADDSDWGVYREINNDKDGDEETRVRRRIEEIEAQLLENDSLFDESMTLAGLDDPKKSLLYAFRHGVEPYPYDESNVAQTHQLHLNVERIRVPEAGLLQPSLAGLDQASIIEIAKHVLQSGSVPDAYTALCGNVHLAGRNTTWPGLKSRIEKELRAIVPVETAVHVHAARNAGLDAWRGANAWVQSLGSSPAEQSNVFLSRDEWLSNGPEYIKEHAWSNRHY